jgi:hypothetical protein
MSVEIKPVIDHEQYEVNGHLILKDATNNWTCQDPLSPKEIRAFRNYEKLIINNLKFKKHTKATYKD